MTAAANDVLPRAIALIVRLGLDYRPNFTASSFPPETCCVGPADPVAAAAALVAEFDEDVLHALGLIEESASGELALATTFTSVSGPLLIVTAPGEQAPRGLIGGNGTAPPGRLPVELLLSDGYTQDALGQNDNVMLLTQTIDAAAAYLALGVPAAPAEPLAGMDPEQRRKLFEVLRAGPIALAPSEDPRPQPADPEKTTGGLKISKDYYPKGGPLAQRKKRIAKRRREPSAGPAPVKPSPLIVRLAGWSPPGVADVDEARLRNDAAWCANAETYTTLELGDLAVWRPAPADQVKLSWVVEYGSDADVRRALRQSWAESSYEVSHFARPDFRPSDAAANLVEAHEDLIDAIRRDDGEAGIEAARHAAWQHAQRQLVRPLLAAAIATEDPLQRVRYAMAAQEAAIGQSLTSELQVALMRRAGNPQEAFSTRDAALLRETGKCIDRTLRLLKSLQ